VLWTVNRVQRIQMHGRLQLVAAVALLMLGALGVAGCGVKGPLEAPGAGPKETGNATPGTPATPGQPVAHKPLILDPLIR
jgi:predicted small lipoprotein YifL